MSKRTSAAEFVGEPNPTSEPIRERRRVQASPPPPDEPRREPPADEGVGYCRPPKHTQFQPGQSGNPTGRPKGALSLNTLVRSMMTEKVTVQTDTGSSRMTKIELLLRKMLVRAGNGDWRAEAQLLNLYSLAVAEEARAREDAEEPGVADARLLRQMAMEFLSVKRSYQDQDYDDNEACDDFDDQQDDDAATER